MNDGEETHRGVERAEANLFCVRNEAGVGLLPGYRYRGSLVGVDEQVKAAALAQ